MSSPQAAARVIEVFPSIQGEGIHVGKPHLFVRFWNCNLACAYCDTDYRGPYREMTPEGLSEEVEQHLRDDGPFHAVSLTGGEPLLWASFLKRWLPWLRGKGQTVYLETNGTLPDALEQVLPWVDIIAMDVKPPSATADRPVWAEHERFLRIAWEASQRPAPVPHPGDRYQVPNHSLVPGTDPPSGTWYRSRPEVFVKVVVTPGTADDEVARAAALIAEVDRGIPLVLQPVTPWGGVSEMPSAEQVARWRRLAGRELTNVRVLPQVHRLLGVR